MSHAKMISFNSDTVNYVIKARHISKKDLAESLEKHPQYIYDALQDGKIAEKYFDKMCYVLNMAPVFASKQLTKNRKLRILEYDFQQFYDTAQIQDPEYGFTEYILNANEIDPCLLSHDQLKELNLRILDTVDMYLHELGLNEFCFLPGEE